MTFLLSYTPLAELVLFNILLAFSQYVVLRAGVFSIGTAAFAALGAYSAAILTTTLGWSPWQGICAALVLGVAAGLLLSIPLARLRGVFQALATLALIQIMLSITLNWVDVTQGALGINGIPKAVGIGGLLCAVLIVAYFLVVIGMSGLGRSFDVIREDETVAVSLGISVARCHSVAFALSGGIGALAGALHAYSSYSITPGEYGFHMAVIVLAMVVLGGRISIWGPVVGAIVLTTLPELLRGFSDYRMVMQGAALMLSIIFLPRGLVDTTLSALRLRRLRRGSSTGTTKAMTP